jgi:cellulose synthase/poly-beta-1,6-N-acetylglucosamine synthase-like glycosyltransferase
VQTRWTHANEAQSPLTRAESIMLDGTFGIEHPVRSDEGLFFNFNGTAGIWRRRCIEEAGGWSGGTLSEDLDLSYRAQLKGWTFRYLVDVAAPAELPTTVSAYKIQQYRWAKGSMQVVRVQAPRVLGAPIGPWKKAHGILHMSGFIVHLMMVLIVLLSLPLALAGTQALQGIPIAWLGIGAVGGPFIIGAAAWALYPKQGWWKRIAWMPVSLMLGTGVAVSNSIAVVSGLLNLSSPFHRTPKPSDDDGGPHRRPLRLRILEDMTTWLELGLAVYTVLAVVLNIEMGMWAQAFYLSIFAAGFSWVALATRVEGIYAWLKRWFSPGTVNPRTE